MHDRDRKGRNRVPHGDNHFTRLHPERVAHGEQHPNAKLTEAEVRDIRYQHQAGLITTGKLAKEFGVNQTTIRHIVRREAWKHVM